MTKNVKGILTVVSVVAVVLTAYHFTHRNSKAYAKQIVKLGGSAGYVVLLTFDEAFLKEWAKALSDGKANFSYKNSLYNTQGGKKIV